MASSYVIPDFASSAITIRGQRLRRARWDAHERAFAGADLYRGKTRLIEPTLAQAAFVAGSSISSVWWAAKRGEVRGEIIAGRLPLVPPRAKIQPVPMLPAPRPVPPITMENAQQLLLELIDALGGTDQVLTLLVAAEQGRIAA